MPPLSQLPRRLCTAFLLAQALLLTAAPASPAEPHQAHPASSPARPGSAAAHHRAPDDATVHHRFSDVARWSAMFDSPERDAWQKPEELVKALSLAPGQRVADLGAGTGYLERHLSRAVGAGGTVFAVDVEPALVEHLRARAEKESTDNVVPILASFDNPRLPAGSLDLILIVDTYHHIDARKRYLERLRQTLARGGRVAIVDFQKRELPVGPPLAHKLDKSEVVEEMTSAGYALAQDLDLLPYQYTLVFRP